MKETRIVFAAVVAFTEQVTRDGRMLSTPEGFHCPVHWSGLPLPVVWTPPNSKGTARPTIHVGRIEEAYVVDRRVIVFGRLDNTEEIREAVVPMLRDGTRVLEIDITSDSVEYDLEPDVLIPEPVGPVVFQKWQLRSAWVGPGGVWDLPRVQIEELTT